MSCGLQDFLQCSDVLLVVLCDCCKPIDSFVEIELLATVSWTCGCQPFSCRCSQNVTHCRKEICWTCLLKESFPAIPFGNSRHPLPTRSLTFLRRRHAPLARHYGCIMPIPLLPLQKKSVSGRQAEGWVMELSSPGIVGSGAGLQPFSCRCWQNLMRCRKEICWTCLFKNPFLPFFLEFQVHTFYQKQVPESGSTLHHSALRRLHHARHIVAAAGKTCPMQRSRGFGHEVAVSKICYTAVIVLLVVL